MTSYSWSRDCEAMSGNSDMTKVCAAVSSSSSLHRQRPPLANVRNFDRDLAWVPLKQRLIKRRQTVPVHVEPLLEHSLKREPAHNMQRVSSLTVSGKMETRTSPGEARSTEPIELILVTVEASSADQRKSEPTCRPPSSCIMTRGAVSPPIPARTQLEPVSTTTMASRVTGAGRR